MKRTLLALLLCCGMAGAMAGCSNDGLDTSAETGELTLRSLNMDQNTRSVDDLGLDPDAFSVEIIDAQQSVVNTYPTFAEMPAKVRLPIGAYTVRASLGSATASGFDAWYFAGEKPVTILSRQLTNETVVCALANVKVAVVFGANLLLDYSDFSAEITSGEADPLLFVKDETRAGYVPAGDLRLTIHMTNNQDRKRSYIAQAYTAYAQEFVTFNIDTEDNPGGLNIAISTDSDTDDREVIIRLYDFMNIKDAPVITGEGFDESDFSLTYREGVKPEAARVNLRSEGTIQSCVVRPDAELQALGWPAEFDLADPALDPGVVADLKDLGLSWYDRMKGAVVASVDVRAAAAKLHWQSGEQTPYTFTVQTTDSFGQTSAEETFTLAVEKPLMGLNAIPVYDMWAYHVDMTGDFSGIDQSALKLQYKTTGDWADCASAVPTIDGTSVAWKVKGLADNTAYQFRMVYGALESETRTASTEEAKQIPNSNFENWYEYKFENNNREIDGQKRTNSTAQYHLHPESAIGTDAWWWDTRNKATKGEDYNYYNTAVFVPVRNESYFNINTTERVSSASGYAALLRTATYGTGTTSGSSGLTESVVANQSSGILFIGEFTYSRYRYTYSLVGSKNAERFYPQNINQGHAFPSRPAKLEFDYIFAPYNNESFLAYAEVLNGSNVIARANATNTDATQGSMTRVSFDFVYTDKTKKATTIKVFFSSSSNLNNGVSTNNKAKPANGETAPSSYPAVEYTFGGGAQIGSVLTIDNVTLNYNFD